MTPLWKQKEQRIERAEKIGRQNAETLSHDELITWASMLCGTIAEYMPVERTTEWLDRMERKVSSKQVPA